jgi:hypothetical protein
VGVDYDELARVFGLPVAQLDRVLTLRVAWLDRPLYFVPTEADAAILVASGETTRGAVWTRQELLDLLSMPSTTKGTVKTVALAKFEFDGEATDVRPELGP